MNIPSADSHKHYDKAGCLLKLCGRGFPYLHQWKSRHCILSKGCLYIYENQQSKGSNKNSYVIDLKFYDQVSQALQKETKKASNVFTVTSQDKTLFDHQGRYMFSAETLTEMHDWINRIRESIEQIRNNNRPSSSTKKERRQSSKESSQATALADLQPSSLADLQPSDDHDGSPEKLRDEVQKVFNEKAFQRLSREIVSVPTTTITAAEDEIQEEPVPKKKVSSQKIFLNKQEANRLESITKHRVKGPSGRRAPQSRKTPSMSALEHENNSSEDAGRTPYLTNHSDLREEENSHNEDLNSSHPALAYHYSSDEESTSGIAACNVVSDICPVVDEYGGPIIHQEDDLKVINGLRINLTTRRGSPPLADSRRNEDLLEYRSLPKSLGKKSCHIKGDTLLMKLPTYETYSSAMRLSSGRASPEMDALDNLLMSQSVSSHNVPCQIVPSDNEGSDGASTCKHPDDVNQMTKSGEHFLKALESCSDVIQQLQHHSTDLELRTNRTENELSLTRNDVANLYETSLGLKNDVEKLAKAVSIISEEASTAHKDMTSQRKESERIQKTSTAALKEAKQASVECDKAKSNYESLIKELHSLIASIRSSLVVTDENGPVPENNQSSHSDGNKRASEMKSSKTTNKDSNKTTGYQSFFQRPTSLIYTLTNRSASKSMSYIDGKSKDRDKKKEIEDTKTKQSHNLDTKKDKEEVKTKQTNSWERKNQKTKTPQDSMERKSRSSNWMDLSQNKTKKEHPLSSHPRETSRSRDKISKLISGRSENISFEDIPMMDDFNESRDPNKKGNTAKGISHVTINVSPAKLEKSTSSPMLTYDKKTNRTNLFNIQADNFGCKINKLSPDSPVKNFIPFENYDSSKDFRFGSDSSPFLPKNLNNIRQSSMTSVPEDLTVPSVNRPGTFAISRQVSSPNISLQRANSGPLFPIQRQHSLGTVAEEGALPRQASLMSVPEERPIVDQTLPLSPSPSLVSFPLSRTSSVADNVRSPPRYSMELVTGPVISGSQIQESFIRSLPPSLEFEDSSNTPMATSSLRRHNERKRNSKIVHV